jgi:hypothetical protein
MRHKLRTKTGRENDPLPGQWRGCAVILAAIALMVLAAGLAAELYLAAAGRGRPVSGAPPAALGVPAEQPVTRIALSGPAADLSAEISGMAWYGDYLIMLPQYPHQLAEVGDGFVFALHRADILAYLDGRSSGPLEPLAVPFEAPGLKDQIPEYEGYEGIAFSGDRAYLTIEAGEDDKMIGYIVSGWMAPDMGKLTVDTGNVTPIAVQTGLDNKSDEALIVLDDRIVTFYEVNGAALNPRPVAHAFSLDLQPLGTLPMAALEYRLTDAALAPGGNRFWVINTFFFYKDENLRPAFDPLAETFGEGPTHAKIDAVERLVELEYSESGVRLTGTPPIQLELPTFITRNWEGLVLLDGRGFLLMTDRFPDTFLGFVPMP